MLQVIHASIPQIPVDSLYRGVPKAETVDRTTLFGERSCKWQTMECDMVRHSGWEDVPSIVES